MLIGGRTTRDDYKQRLADSVDAGTVTSLAGGIDLAPELVGAMDLFRAGKSDPSLRHFIESLRSCLRDATRA